jgi:hypothetical protein
VVPVILFGVGIVGQFLGLWITLVGLDDVKRDLYGPESSLRFVGPTRDRCGAAWAWLLRHLHVRRRRTVALAGTAQVVASAGSLGVQQSSAPVIPPTRDAERWTWIVDRLNELRVRVDNKYKTMSTRLVNVSDDIDTLARDLRADIARGRGSDDDRGAQAVRRERARSTSPRSPSRSQSSAPCSPHAPRSRSKRTLPRV